MLQKIKRNWRRRRQAKQWQIDFRRIRDFKLPTSLWIGNRRVPVRLPEEGAVVTAFVALLLDDEYGVSTVPGAVKTVLDIGGNIGLFGLMARRFFPEAVMHLYEPNPSLKESLLVQCEGVGSHYFAEAVGGFDGQVTFIGNPDSMVGRIASDLVGEIPQVSLRTAIERLGGSVDFAKIDCEGSEWDIIEDTDSLSRIKHLALEYHPRKGCSVVLLRERLRQCGFHLRKEIATAGGCGVIQASRDSSLIRPAA